MEIRKATVNDI
jgi:hypothetical protein